MENAIVIAIKALGQLGEKYVHILLDVVEKFVTDSKTPVDNALFYKVVANIQSWKPKNFTE